MANGLKTALLLGTLSGLLLVIGELLGGANGLMLAFAFALIMNFGSYWFSDKIVLRMYRAQQVGPEHRLYQMTARLAQRAGLPMPKVYLIPDPSPNAFATGRNPSHAAVAATQGILEVLSESELEGVIAHELAHVKNRDILISSVAATIAAFFIQMAISRSREFAADATGAQIAGTPYGLANALQKIEAASKRVPLDANPATAHMFIMKPFTGGGLMALFSSHPPTEARVRKLLGTIR